MRADYFMLWILVGKFQPFYILFKKLALILLRYETLIMTQVSRLQKSPGIFSSVRITFGFYRSEVSP